MTQNEIKAMIQEKLPDIIVHDPLFRDFVLKIVSEYYSPKKETDNKFDRILLELQRDREEQTRKWEEQKNLNKEIMEEIKKLSKKHDSTIGALGSRWGLYSEASFRNALKGILENSFGVEVLNINDYDDIGEVFGRPDQVEIDIIIKNGLTILCEIKSSMSKPDMYTFHKKIEFYEKRHAKKANRRIVISPMVAPKAVQVAIDLGIEIYSYAEADEIFDHSPIL